MISFFFEGEGRKICYFLFEFYQKFLLKTTGSDYLFFTSFMPIIYFSITLVVD